MTKNNNTKIGTATAAPVIDGLAEALGNTKQAKAERLAELKKSAKKTSRDAAKLETWKAKMAERNPAVLVDTVRPVPVGEALPSGLISKGRVVDIACEVCGEIRTVNVQDAFQVRYCEEHKAEARKAAAKVRRDAKKVEALMEIDEDELDAQIAELEAAAA